MYEVRKIFIGALLGLLFMAATLWAVARANGAPVLSYVYSDSMEPLIKVNDAFFIWPDQEPSIGDIIMYRPAILPAPYITHRIIDIGDYGYVTKGDNSPYIDQESGEPEVTLDRIAGKVVTVNGQPILIPGLGNLSAILRGGIGAYAKGLSGIFIVLAAASMFTGRHNNRKRKSRHRFRLRHVYRFITILAALLVMISIYMGSGVSRVKYLVSEYPGSTSDQIEVNKPGTLIMEIKNNGIFPAWTIQQGIDPINVSDGPGYLMPRTGAPAILKVLPRRETGIFQGYIQAYQYPILMPRTWTVFFHNQHPVLAILMNGMAFGLWSALFFKLLNHVHGFEEWIPLSAIKNKLSERRMKRIKARIIGRRRAR